ncbi:MAG: YpdA family putative bacillithiol disulfide reductase [Ignavibacteriae bacterium]|nr:YpdA family putative bacillithiol disulfide reductase [Ignavibacteriota bacterium]
MSSIYDVIIVGAGPIGLACAIESVKNNLSHLILEKGSLTNSIFHYPTNMVFFSTSERLEIGDVPFISHGVKPTRTEALEYYRRVKDKWNLKVNTYEKVENIFSIEKLFKVETNKNNFFAKKIIVSTGFYDFPNLMNIPGEELDKVKHYYHEPHPFAYEKIIVVGGGNSAVDVALETFRRGAEVTMVIRGNSLEDNVKYWVKPDIENRIKENEIKVFYNSELKEIREKEVDIISPTEILTIPNDFVLAMTGYKPDFNFLQKIGIKISDKNKIPFYKEETFETNISGLYLAGVVCGGLNTSKWFIENSRIHAPIIFKHLLANIN